MFLINRSKYIKANKEMSRNQSVVAKKVCCVVCKSAGKSEREWSSHFVKNGSGQVCCPIIKNNVCSYCNKKGHSVKYCHRKQYDESKLQSEKLNGKKEKKVIEKKVTPKNRFSFGDEDDDDNVKSYKTKVFAEKVTKPALVKKVEVEVKEEKVCNSFLNAVLGKNKPLTPQQSPPQSPPPSVKQMAIISPRPAPVRKPLLSWACDSDDSDDDDE
jgi:hypothetical protein